MSECIPHTVAEILELDNVIINLQDLIKPATILILLFPKSTTGEGLQKGGYHRKILSVAEMRGWRRLLLVNQYIPVRLAIFKLCSLRICIRYLYCRCMLQDH